MRIAVCISGAFRNSEDTVVRNLRLLRAEGHTVDLYIRFQWPQLGQDYRNSFDGNPHSRIAAHVPWVPAFRTQFVSSREQTEIVSRLGPVSHGVEERSIEELIESSGLSSTWNKLFQSQCGLEIFEGLIPHEPHFRNTLFMLANIYEVDVLRQQSNICYDGVLRLRPDFLMSEEFVRQLDKDVVTVPIRTSGREFDYGWGHMSDQCFFASPDNMTKLTSVYRALPQLWQPEIVYQPASFSAPFLYGDVIMCFWLHHQLLSPKRFVPNGGDLQREPQVNLFPGNRAFRPLRSNLREWLAYNKSLSQWQKMQLRYSNT